MFIVLTRLLTTGSLQIPKDTGQVNKTHVHSFQKGTPAPPHCTLQSLSRASYLELAFTGLSTSVILFLFSSILKIL